MKTGYFESPLGYIKYEYDEENRIYSSSFHFGEEPPVEYSSKINAALTLYFAGNLKKFPFKYSLKNNTEFQKKVLRALQRIPYGETRSYSEIAEKIGNPKAVRAVGQACKSNPVGIMIPCHRVIGKNQKLTGYSGKDYVYLKEKLLDLEKKFK